MTTSPQCFGTAPGFGEPGFWAEDPASDAGGVVVILTGTSSFVPAREEAGDTGPRRVARGCR